MRKAIILSLCLLGGYGAAHAQSLPSRQDTTVTYDTDRYKVVTNRFGDNWFIGAAAGAQIYLGDHDKQMKFSERLTPFYSFNLGKWFSPGIGARLGVSGMKLKGLTQYFEPSHSTGVRYDGKPWDGYWLEHQEFKYYHIYGDVLFNLSNLFGGYKESRFYTISPYVGLGWITGTDKPKQREVSANGGIYNTFRLGRSWDLTLDVKGSLVNDRFDGEIGGRKNEGLVSAALGITYKFNKSDWDKPATTVIRTTYDESLLDALRQKVAKLAEDNDALRRQLADASGKTITDIKFQDRLLASPILVTFPINKSTVSNEARVNLGLFAQTVKKAEKNVVYLVTGYADQGTGSAARNLQLSKERAEAIYKVLVNEYGVSPSQLEVDYKGGVANMYYDDPRLSRAVITIAK